MGMEIGEIPSTDAGMSWPCPNSIKANSKTMKLNWKVVVVQIIFKETGLHHIPSIASIFNTFVQIVHFLESGFRFLAFCNF